MLSKDLQALQNSLNPEKLEVKKSDFPSDFVFGVLSTVLTAAVLVHILCGN